MVRVLHRALAILECFSVEKPALSLQEIYRRVGLPKSTTFRLVSTLVEAGYMRQRADQRYALSHKLLQLGGLLRRSLDVQELLRPELAALAHATGETVLLSVRSGHERICIDMVERHPMLRSVVAPGERLPLLYGASGKLFLAHLDDATVELIRRTQQVPDRRVSRKELTGVIASIRRHGYAVIRDDRVDGFTGVAVPVHDLCGEVRYCLTVTGPNLRLVSREPALAAQLAQAARKVSALLGHVEPALAA